MQISFPLTSVVLQTNVLTVAPVLKTGNQQFFRAFGYRPLNEQCNANLKTIRHAKLLWERDKRRISSDVPTEEELLPYFLNATEPQCPEGGVYTLGTAHENPQCSRPGHILEEPEVLSD